MAMMLVVCLTSLPFGELKEGVQADLKEGVKFPLHNTKLETREEFKDDHHIVVKSPKQVIEQCNAARQKDAVPPPCLFGEHAFLIVRPARIDKEMYRCFSGRPTRHVVSCCSNLDPSFIKTTSCRQVLRQARYLLFKGAKVECTMHIKTHCWVR